MATIPGILVARTPPAQLPLNIAIVAVLLLGCGGSNSAPTGSGKSNANSSKKLQIVATTAMVADVVRNVVGDEAEVTGLLGESVDPHIYQPNRGDMSRMNDADMVFYSGLLLEGKFDDAFQQLKNSGKTVVAITEEIDEATLRFPKEFKGHPDPHVWMDVSAWSACAEVIANHVIKQQPELEEKIRANTAKYREQLEKLDQYAKNAIGSIPQQQRVLVTAHDAFGYFARAYEIEVRSPQGITTESTPAVKDINAIVDFLVQRKIQAVFVESSVSEENIKAVIEGAQRKGLEVRVNGPLYSDAMGKAGTYEGTYQGMIDHNATLIARALGGEAPERGMAGKLSLTRQQPE